MTPFIGIGLSIAILFAAMLSLSFTQNKVGEAPRLGTRFDLMGIYLVIAMCGVSICAILLIPPVGLVIAKWTAFAAIGYGVLGQIIAATGLYKHLRGKATNA